MAKRVLVTGAGGLIGLPTVEALRELDFEVFSVERTQSGRDGSTTLIADMLDPAARKAVLSEVKPTHLVHLAWHSSSADRWTSPANAAWTSASKDLAQEFASVGGQRAVFIGSCAEYDWSFPLLAEDTPLAPTSAYGRAKAETGTWLVHSADDLGLSLAWARLFFCFGPAEPKGRLLGDLIDGLLSGRRVPCTDGLQARDFLYSVDVGRAIATVLESDCHGPINIGSGVATPVRAIIKATAELIGRPDLIEMGAKPRPVGDPDVIIADTRRLTSLGFCPAFDLRSALVDIVSAARRNRVPHKVGGG